MLRGDEQEVGQGRVLGPPGVEPVEHGAVELTVAEVEGEVVGRFGLLARRTSRSSSISPWDHAQDGRHAQPSAGRQGELRPHVAEQEGDGGPARTDLAGDGAVERPGPPSGHGPPGPGVSQAILDGQRHVVPGLVETDAAGIRRSLRLRSRRRTFRNWHGA
jgi:hypothetical protein